MEKALGDLNEKTQEFINKEDSSEGPLSNRDMSGFPVSIGTGLALETLFDPIMEVVDDGRSFVKMRDLKRYNLYIINVETLVRNIISSVSTEVVMDVTGKEVLEVLKDEMDFLTYFFEDNGLSIRYYYNTYGYFKDTYKDTYRIPTTPRQQHIMELTTYCLDRVRTFNPDVKRFTQFISFGSSTQALVLTHIPADLLSYSKFRVMDLLESHTGVIKSRELFNTKYYPVPREDMSFLPFFEYLLVTFGDKVMFRPAPIKKRQEVLNNLKRLEVHPLMSEFSMSLLHSVK